MSSDEAFVPAGDEPQPAAPRPAASTAAKAAPRNDLDPITASRTAGAELRAHDAGRQGIAKRLDTPIPDLSRSRAQGHGPLAAVTRSAPRRTRTEPQMRPAPGRRAAAESRPWPAPPRR